jgi:GPH family glycoside/pentoside/hexuronide:cation symporter
MNVAPENLSAPTKPADRVPFGSKAAYGAAGNVDILNLIPHQMTQAIFVVLLGLSPALLSTVAIIFRLWDAFIDPFIGMKSDNTRSRWGRRKPYVFVGAILTGLWFPMLWIVGPDWSPNAIVAWFIFASLLLATFQSIWGVPYQSMLLEMTPDYRERTSITAFRTFFQKIGGLGIAWVFFLTQLPIFVDAAGKPDMLLGIRVISVIGGVLIIVFGLLPVLFVKERFYETASHQPKVPMMESIRLTAKNRPFLILCAFTLLMSIGTSVVAALTFYINLYHIFGGDLVRAGALTGLYGTVSMISGLLGIPMFQWISNRIGKTKALGISMAVVLFGSFVTWWTMTPENPYLSLISGVLNSPGWTGVWMLIPSMLADVADHDELQTSERREGSFAAIFSWLHKLSATLGYGLSGPVVVLAGFQAGLKTMPPPEVLLNMRLYYAFLPALFLVPAIILLMRYPLSPKAMIDIREQLEARRGKV